AREGRCSACGVPPFGGDLMVAAWPRSVAGVLALEVEVEAAWSGLDLALVLIPARAVRILHGAVHAHEGDLPDRHAVVDRDREVGHVRELEREVAGEAAVHEAGRGVDQETEASKRALALEAGHEVVRQRDPLERLTEHELAGMEDE